MKKRRGLLREATKELLEAIESEIISTEVKLENLKKERGFLQKKLDEDEQ